MIYLDHAATSFPKPESVIRAVESALRNDCGNPGRGSHRLALRASEILYDCRVKAAAFFGSDNPEGVIFTPNTTASLNLAFKGLIRRGDHVLISDLEHNAVWRQASRLEREGGSFDCFPTVRGEKRLGDEEICQGIAERIRPNTRALVCLHQSNLCSVVLPIQKIGALCKKRGILFLLDAAQSAGHLPISMKEAQISVLAVPGHKGLLGPQGSGMLLLAKGVLPSPLLDGGTGVYSLEARMPQTLPERLEAGTLSVPCIAGLKAGMEEAEALGLANVKAREDAFFIRLRDRLSDLPALHVYLPEEVGSVLLFSHDRIPAERIGTALDRLGFCVRAGYHCAAVAHRTLGTPKGGAVRVSPGYDCRISDADSFADAVKSIL